jgi:hypothetical protein
MASLTSLFAQWLGLPTTGPAPRASPPSATDRVTAEREYPLAARGLPAIGVAEVMAPHANWLCRLRDAYGAEESTFERDIGSVVERYAQFVHLLPATRDSHFRHAGGLFRMGAEIAFYALQASDGAIFSGRQTLSARSTLEPRWRYAAFLAGLCSELHRPLSHFSVRNEHGAEWPAYEQPLARWLQQTGSRRYYLRWVDAAPTTRPLGILAMTQIIAPAVLQSLAAGNSVIVPQCIAAISGAPSSGEAGTLAALVRRAAAVVLEAERCSEPDGVDAAAAGAQAPAPSPPSPPPAGLPALALCAPARLHPAVREALRQIIARLNSPSSPPAARVMSDGVFVPLQLFAHHHVDPALAVRALGEAGMLSCAADTPQSRTCLREVEHEPVLGLVLAPRWVRTADGAVHGAPIASEGSAP